MLLLCTGQPVTAAWPDDSPELRPTHGKARVLATVPGEARTPPASASSHHRDMSSCVQLQPHRTVCQCLRGQFSFEVEDGRAPPPCPPLLLPFLSLTRPLPLGAPIARPGRRFTSAASSHPHGRHRRASLYPELRESKGQLVTAEPRDHPRSAGVFHGATWLRRLSRVIAD